MLSTRRARRWSWIVTLLAIATVTATTGAAVAVEELPEVPEAFGQGGPPENAEQFDAPGDWTVGGSLGVGTETPTHRIQIVEPGATLVGQRMTNDLADFVLTVQSAGMTIFDWMTQRTVVWIKPDNPPFALVLENGNLGLGELAPEASLEVERSDGSAKVLVDENSGTAARRTLFEIENQGQAAFTIRDAIGGAAGTNTWLFATRGGDAFEINKGGTGGTELLIRGNGRVQMGPGPATTFDLSPTGNLTIGGSLTEGSSRAVKEAVVPVDAAEVLAKVVALPVAEWSYRSDRGVRHLGPMAEDFFVSFGLGQDGAGISAIDTGGVALVSIQALAAENAELRVANRALEERLVVLEQVVADLAGG
jgi:hypothetical protein